MKKEGPKKISAKATAKTAASKATIGRPRGRPKKQDKTTAAKKPDEKEKKASNVVEVIFEPKRLPSRKPTAAPGEVNKGGKPKIYMEEEHIHQVEALASVLSIDQIADYFGIDRSSFYSIMERQPEVRRRYKMGKARAIGRVAKGLLQDAINGDKASQIFYLKTQADWRESLRLEHTARTPDEQEAQDMRAERQRLKMLEMLGPVEDD